MSKKNGNGGPRLDDSGTPILVVTSNLKKYCHEMVDDLDEDGDVITVKMRTTGPFLDKFNLTVFRLLNAAIQSARLDDRTTMKPEDIPELDELPHLEEEEEPDQLEA